MSKTKSPVNYILGRHLTIGQVINELKWLSDIHKDARYLPTENLPESIHTYLRKNATYPHLKMKLTYLDNLTGTQFAIWLCQNSPCLAQQLKLGHE